MYRLWYPAALTLAVGVSALAPGSCARLEKCGQAKGPAREQQKKETVREFLLKHVNDKRKPIQLAAINALGTLGDAKALSVLEKFAEAPKESSDRAAAEKAVASLRDSRKTSVELGTLRNELLSLQKENRELRKQFDDLKKKIEAAIPQTATLRANKPIPSPRGGR